MCHGDTMKSLNHHENQWSTFTNLITDCAELNLIESKIHFATHGNFHPYAMPNAPTQASLKFFLWLSVHRHVERQMRTIKFLFHPIIRVMNRICTTHSRPYLPDAVYVVPMKTCTTQTQFGALNENFPIFHSSKQASRQATGRMTRRTSRFQLPKEPRRTRFMLCMELPLFWFSQSLNPLHLCHCRNLWQNTPQQQQHAAQRQKVSRVFMFIANPENASDGAAFSKKLLFDNGNAELSCRKAECGREWEISLIFLNPEKRKNFLRSRSGLFAVIVALSGVVVAITILSQATLSWIQPLEIITHTIISMIPI